MIAAKAIRPLLLLDAMTCTVMGSVLLLGRSPIAGLTGLPEPLLLWAAIVLFPVALFMAATGLGDPVNRSAAQVVVLGNILWVLASLLVIALVTSVTALGVSFILVQAAAVAVLAWLEHVALRTQSA